ncbi:patatin-like phospholipase family protein [Aurantimonas sp. HBX-1]|uniref:patatin-like phospholipase family protein n=1 Tax=Aurantimonas sp. HBX-1 TaxID=2906072 RepID=UPI001F33CC10|nr:patatin-like phospholipase family protein [Aurantimonas sp. HBX-1]UIJ71259.1 patatin-like phospholipase family protein [Aurantimonas sp. HBX-1]
MSDVALALGGGGARGIAHIHVLEALDELGVRPSRIVGSSIGAVMAAGYAAGMSGAEIRGYALETFARKREVLARLWRTRPLSLQDFVEEGGFRLGQLNARRVLAAFLPTGLPADFEELRIPLGVMATDFYERAECELDSGDLISALAASCALPAIFRPVRRKGRVLIDGGIFNPLPFDRLCDKADIVIAVDVNGGPEGDGASLPTPMEAMFGATQLMMQSIIDTKLKLRAPDLLLRPPVDHYRVLDFLLTRQILAETAPFKEEAKRAIDLALSGKRIGNPDTGRRAAGAGL